MHRKTGPGKCLPRSRENAIQLSALLMIDGFGWGKIGVGTGNVRVALTLFLFQRAFSDDLFL